VEGGDAEITRLLHARKGGFDVLIRLAYDELRRMASHEKQRVFSGRPVTLQATEVVHEVWEQLREASEKCVSGRHFFGVARVIIRQSLISYARERMALKRGAGLRGMALDDAVDIAAPDDPDQLPLEYAELLEKFGAVDARASEVFSLCDLAGMTRPDVAGLLGLSLATVERDLKFARAWWASQLA
jgi:RNA polymerase sigma factor (TIGR02999 family)